MWAFAMFLRGKCEMLCRLKMNMLFISVITFQQIKNVMLKLQLYSIQLIIKFETSTNRHKLMHQYDQQRSIPFYNHSNHTFSLEDDDFQHEHPNRIPLDIHKEPQDLDFEQIFSGNFPPKFTTISVSTQSNRSYDVNDISQEFFSNDIALNGLNGEALDYDPYQLSEEKIIQVEQPKEEENKDVMVSSNGSRESEKKSLEPQNCHDETKNIPKNYIKAIFTFIIENPEYIERLFAKVDLRESSIGSLLEYVKTEKKTKRYTIQRLKSLWMDKQNGKAMRIISSQFLRKRSLSYICGSKIEKKMHHIKHRNKFLKAIENPAEFTNIK